MEHIDNGILWLEASIRFLQLLEWLMLFFINYLLLFIIFMLW